MKNHFSLKGKKEKGKITRQTLNNFTIIKLIKIILMYVSQLKKKYIYIYIYFFYCHTHKLSFLKGNNPFSLLFFTVRHPPFFHRAAPPFPSSCCVLLFSTPHACLLYIQFCHLTLLGTYGVLTFHVSPISS